MRQLTKVVVFDATILFLFLGKKKVIERIIDNNNQMNVTTRPRLNA